MRLKTENLKQYQREEIEEILNRFAVSNSIDPLTISKSNLACPHCNSSEYINNGSARGRKRYQCSNKECRRTFSVSSNTSLHKMQKVDHWTDFVYLMLSSPNPLTLKELATKLKISTKTAHTWKHKLLAALNEQEKIKLSGIVEMDEVFVPFCVKGKRGLEKTNTVKSLESKHIKNKQNSVFLCVHNRNKDFNFFPIKIQQKGQFFAKDIGRIVEQLDIEPNTVVVTDGSKASTKYFKSRPDLTHEIFISKGKKTPIKHNNNINSTMSLFKTWKAGFRGYSTKYEWNYLNWFRFHRKYQDGFLKYMVNHSVKDKKAITRFTDIKDYYQDFLKTAS